MLHVKQQGRPSDSTKAHFAFLLLKKKDNKIINNSLHPYLIVSTNWNNRNTRTIEVKETMLQMGPTT